MKCVCGHEDDIHKDNTEGDGPCTACSCGSFEEDIDDDEET